MHDWHVENDARMYAAGLWQRPMVYALPGETVEQAYVREAGAVRARVGIVDVSTLGKIAIQGPDAAEFLDRVYTNTFSTLPVNRARYGLMLREEGIAFDDGTTWRLGEHDFLMTTTTANAGKVMQHLEYYIDTVWPDLKVRVTSVTDQWAGRGSRRASCAGGAGNAASRQPRLTIPRFRRWASCAARWPARPSPSAASPFRANSPMRSIAVPATVCSSGRSCWRPANPLASCPTGSKPSARCASRRAMSPAPKSTVRTGPRDLYLDWMLSKKKPFIGSATMDRDGLIAKDRLKLVGIVALDNRALAGGAHIVDKADPDNPRGSIGHVTAACYSPRARQVHRACPRPGRQEAARDPRLCFRSAAQPLRSRRDRQPSLLRRRWEPDEWLSRFPPWRRSIFTVGTVTLKVCRA